MLRKTTARFILFLTAFVLTAASQSVAVAQLEATPVPPEQPAESTSEPMIAQPAQTIPDTLESAGEYCLLHEGILVERFPFIGTNGESLMQLDGSRWFCEFSGSPEADPPTSRISVGLSTLYATEPTLAAIAYLSAPPIVPMDEDANQAVTYCAQLGGSSEFGSDSSAGGGWASDPTDPSSTSIGICVFPDGSEIDDWGLTYHSNGVIRGANLESIFRYQPQTVPDFVFP